MSEENMPEFDFSGEFDNIEDEIAKAKAAEEKPEGESRFFAWQVCLADMENNALLNADDYPNYIVNRDAIVQMLGVGMASGQNAFPVDGQMFVAAISMQVDGEIQLVSTEFPRYNDIAAVVSEELLSGKDHGMVVELPNGNIIPIALPMDPSNI